MPRRLLAYRSAQSLFRSAGNAFLVWDFLHVECHWTGTCPNVVPTPRMHILIELIVKPYLKMFTYRSAVSCSDWVWDPKLPLPPSFLQKMSLLLFEEV